MSKIRFQHTYHTIISLENILDAWKEFSRGKKSRKDVQEFERDLMTNIISLHRDLAAKTYRHSAYQAFKISDPKPRDIHKASVRDRLLHHAIHRKLMPFFEKTFISDSTSCQTGKGTHRALRRFKQFTDSVSRNDTKTVWVLKCDIKKFFANIDQTILLEILSEYIPDKDIVWLVSVIVGSFDSSVPGIGLPLGNLTSQLLVNIYMNEFDQFMKHKMKATHYIRYADDFAVLSRDRAYLERILPLMQGFLWDRLRLTMHPNKISIETLASGVDFLGWVHSPHHRVLRTATKRRMFANPGIYVADEAVVNSYKGLLSHGNAHKLVRRVEGIAREANLTKNASSGILRK